MVTPRPLPPATALVSDPDARIEVEDQEVSPDPERIPAGFLRNAIDKPEQPGPFSHLALTVIEDPGEVAGYHWLLLEAVDGGVREYAASDTRYPNATEAFQAGTTQWLLQYSREDVEADPVGDNAQP